MLELVLLLLLLRLLLSDWLTLRVQHQRTAVGARHTARAGPVRSWRLLAVAILQSVLGMVVVRWRRCLVVSVLGLVVSCPVIAPVRVGDVRSIHTGVEVIHTVA